MMIIIVVVTIFFKMTQVDARFASTMPMLKYDFNTKAIFQNTSPKGRRDAPRLPAPLPTIPLDFGSQQPSLDLPMPVCTLCN